MVDWADANKKLQSSNPAAPEGLQQAADRADAKENPQGEWAQRAAKLQPWTPPDSYTEIAQQWYGGQNTEGVNNGFDNGFMQATFDYIASKEAEAGRTKNPTTMWDMWDTTRRGNENATGVATWDDPSGRNRWKVGDVFENGKRLDNGNLYETFDRKTANLMLADFMFTADEKKRIFADSDRDGKLDREVTQRTAENTETAKNAPAAWDFQVDKTARETDYQESGAADIGSTALGAGGGAALGAGIGTAIAPGLGTALGAGIGAAVGGFGAWLNRDQLTEVAARAAEVSERAYERYGYLGGTAQAVKEYSALANKAITPISNTYQGTYDWLAGDLGDGESEFYAVNEKGERKASALHVGLDIAACLGDSVLQFASPVGRQMYMAQMGMTTAGGTASLFTGGTFNARVGDFHQYENAGQWAAAVGAVTIDAAQMGTAQALYNTARHAQARLLNQSTASRVAPRAWRASSSPCPRRARRWTPDGRWTVWPPPSCCATSRCR